MACTFYMYILYIPLHFAAVNESRRSVTVAIVDSISYTCNPILAAASKVTC